MIGSRGWVSVVELIVYIPAAVLSLIVCSRHGFRRSTGWIFTHLLCIIRIIGAILQLLTYHNHSTGLLTWSIVIDSIGVSPLLLATLGLLSRFIDCINANGSSPFGMKHFRIIQVLITVGLILSIVGGTSSNLGSNGNIEIPTTSKVGVILYIVAFCAMTLVCLISSPKAGVVPPRERRVPLAVMLALPFIAVRLIYSILSVTLHNHLFNIATGSVVVFAVMTVTEEFIVLAIYLLLGFSLDKLNQDEQGPLASRPWMKKRGQGDHRMRGPYAASGHAPNVDPDSNRLAYNPNSSIPMTAYRQDHSAGQSV